MGHSTYQHPGFSHSTPQTQRPTDSWIHGPKKPPTHEPVDPQTPKPTDRPTNRCPDPWTHRQTRRHTDFHKHSYTHIYHSLAGFPNAVVPQRGKPLWTLTALKILTKHLLCVGPGITEGYTALELTAKKEGKACQPHSSYRALLLQSHGVFNC